jgi:hypothetical protein
LATGRETFFLYIPRGASYWAVLCFVLTPSGVRCTSVLRHQCNQIVLGDATFTVLANTVGFVTIFMVISMVGAVIFHTVAIAVTVVAIVKNTYGTVIGAITIVIAVGVIVTDINSCWQVYYCAADVGRLSVGFTSHHHSLLRGEVNGVDPNARADLRCATALSGVGR